MSDSALTFVALGSNLQNPSQQLHKALDALAALRESRLLRVSSFYCSAAVGPGDQPDYLNAVALLETSLSPVELLSALQAIESAQGRIRGERWAPRTLDLDILLYDAQTIDTAQLTIPHPRMQDRDFVLYPLREISDTKTLLPGGQDLDELIAQLPRSTMARTGETYSLDCNSSLQPEERKH